ncbi:MAG: hypothetical protein ACK54V_00105 [Candidatus Kapaibacterium sp.]
MPNTAGYCRHSTSFFPEFIIRSSSLHQQLSSVWLRPGKSLCSFAAIHAMNYVFFRDIGLKD